MRHQQTHAPLPGCEEVGVACVEKNMPHAPTGFSPKVVPHSATTELELVLDLPGMLPDRKLLCLPANRDVIVMSVHLSVTPTGIWRAARMS